MTLPQIIAGESIRRGTHTRIIWRIRPRDEDTTGVTQTLVSRELEGLAIDLVLTETAPEQKLVLSINGKPYMAHQALLKLLFCLLAQPGWVYPFEHLSRALGLRGRDARRNKNTLVEHARRCRLLLTGAKLPLCVAIVPEVGYALCRKAPPALKR